MHHVTALRQVIEADLRHLGELESRLEEARGPQVKAVVASLGKCCDSLSRGLTRIAKNVDTIAEPEPGPPPKPVHDLRPLEVSARFFSLIENGPCACGNVIPPQEASPEAAPTWRAANRARRASE